jgi:hypothetical protein
LEWNASKTKIAASNAALIFSIGGHHPFATVNA